jgi:predicted nuclease of predicted toxin-antitoxin system
VRFLVDNQLSPALVRFLNERGHDARHVLDLGLDEAADSAIWRRAAAEQRVLISKDEDFLPLASQPDTDPAFVWVRLPNCRKGALLAAFESALPSLITALGAGNRVVEIR